MVLTGAGISMGTSWSTVISHQSPVSYQSGATTRDPRWSHLQITPVSVQESRGLQIGGFTAGAVTLPAVRQTQGSEGTQEEDQQEDDHHHHQYQSWTSPSLMAELETLTGASRQISEATSPD